MGAVSVEDHLSAIADDRRRAEARRLDGLFREVTGWRPRLWGKVIGYGAYHYKYDSGHEGDTFATGFAPLARQHSLHIMPGYDAFADIAARLGPHTRGKSCWYIKRLDAIDEAALKDLIRAGLDDLARLFPVTPT